MKLINLGAINIATGAYTTIGETTLNQIGNGLASLSFLIQMSFSKQEPILMNLIPAPVSLLMLKA
jgi:hypothetical protein